jgi:hypothetical protein
VGPHPMSRPPKYVQGFIDRHGKPRFYFRRPGFKAVALPGLPWSPEFMVAYETALAGQPAPIGASRVKAGTMRALAVSYYDSIAFRQLGASTQSVYRNIIDKFCRETDRDGKPSEPLRLHDFSQMSVRHSHDRHYTGRQHWCQPRPRSSPCQTTSCFST